MDYSKEYKEKLTTAEEAVKIIKSGDWVELGYGYCFPKLCEEALANRKDELEDVKIRGNNELGPLRTVEADPEQEHFTYHSWFVCGYERKLADQGLCFYSPMNYRSLEWLYKTQLEPDVTILQVAPMDEYGYFNVSIDAGGGRAYMCHSKKVIVEINENLPRIHGDGRQLIHLSEVDLIVEGSNNPIPETPDRAGTEDDATIAKFVLPYIHDGATIQLGVGGMPSALGELIAKSDLKDLGMHTELIGDSFLHLYEAGVVTNRRKKVLPGVGVFGVAIGTKKLYDWLNDNPAVMGMPLSYVNDPWVIREMDEFVSINGCVAVDLYGQVSSESAGTRHISGSGGQLDFAIGAGLSPNGKSFLCLKSVFSDKNGNLHSNIVPHFNGEIITTPRSQAQFIATEYGVTSLPGKTVWERAEALIGIAHPDFREELIRAAEEQKIWRRSNKR